MNMKWNTETQQWVIAGVMVLIVALAGWWLFTRPAADQGDANKTATSTNQTSGTTTSNNDGRPTTGMSAGETVTIETQTAGDHVHVAQAQLSRVSWLAVRDDLRIYGAARVNPPVGGGTVSEVTIPLLRNTESGKSYTLVVYADDGDGAFDFKKDALVEGLSATFSVSGQHE